MVTQAQQKNVSDLETEATKTIWGLFQHAGCANEKLVSTWKSYEDARCAMWESYTESEQEELGVDVMVKRGDEAWSTEY